MTGATIRNDFTGALKEKGGNGTVYRDASEAMTNELFDCATGELYKRCNSNPRDRSTLPHEVQKVYGIAETKATWAVRKHDVQGQTQQEVNSELVEVVREDSRDTKNWLQNSLGF